MSQAMREIAYDLAFLRATYFDASNLASDHEAAFFIPSYDLWRSYEFFHLWFTAFIAEYMPEDHPVRQRLWSDPYNLARVNARAYIPADDDHEGWQALRDAIGDLYIVRFRYWFPGLAEHPLARTLAEEFGIVRWLDLALEDPGSPTGFSMVVMDPFGGNWTRRCLDRYTFPVPLDITAEECQASLRWIETLLEHATAAAEEIETIDQTVQVALADSGFDLAQLVGTWAYQKRWFDAAILELPERIRVFRELLRYSLTAVEQLEAERSPEELEIRDLVTAFRRFWTIWFSWFPATVAEARGVPLDRFPPAPEDTTGWSIVAETLGELPLVRFGYWFADVADETWERLLARELGIAERLTAVLAQRGEPILTDPDEPALLARRWRFTPSGLPPVTADEARRIFEWLERLRERIEAVLTMITLGK